MANGNPQNSRDWAIVVGIKDYSSLPILNGPVNDANDFHDWLVHPGPGGVPQQQVFRIQSPSPPQNGSPSPTVQDLSDAFDTLDDIAERNLAAHQGLKVGRRLYLYFSGHGCAPKFEEAAILAANATPRRVYHLAGKPCADWMARAGYFDEVVLLMDCCRNRVERFQVHILPWMDVVDREAARKLRRFYAFGCKWSQLSRERPDDQGRVTGVFTRALLAGLQGAAYDPATEFHRNGVPMAYVTSTSLSAYLLQHMKDYLAPQDLNDPQVATEPDVDHDPAGVLQFAAVPIPCFPVTFQVSAADVGKTLRIGRLVTGSPIPQFLVEQVMPDTSLIVQLSRQFYVAELDGRPLVPFPVDAVAGAQHVVQLS